MSNFNITLKNYRCFDRKYPLHIEIGEGFTALIGPNNSGKSAFLKMFYEVRAAFSDTPSSHPEFSGAFPLEVFSDANDSRELELTISFSGDNNQSKEISLKYSLGNDGLALSGDFFSKDCRPIADDMLNTFYIGPYRNFTCQSEKFYYDILVGTQFISKWQEWSKWQNPKTGGDNRRQLVIQDVIKTTKETFGFNNLDIFVEKDTIQLKIDDKSYKLTEVGTGLAQFIMVLGNLAMRETKPSYILIDEPELNLHPLLQMEFLLNLRQYAEKGVIFATHSMGLARAVADRIYTFQRREGKTSVKPFGSPKDYAEFLKDMSISSYTELGFEKVLLVEGPSEIKTIQEFLRKKKQDHRVLLLPLGGDALINAKTAHELGEFKRISDNIFALVDREEGAKQTQHERFKNSCGTMKIDCHILERRALENYFTEAAVQKVLGNQVNELGPYGKPDDANYCWGKNGGKYKKTTYNCQIAQEMEWTDIKDTDLGIFLDKICNQPVSVQCASEQETG